jgi:acyl phosphate:glycerol-3-phosphate acyltransferase
MSFYIATAVIAYLLGSIPFGYILVRVFRGQDVRDTGSGNIGATNVARASPALGIITLLLDAGKGYAAVRIALHLAWQSAMTIPPGAHVEPLMGGSPAEFHARMQASLAATGHIYFVGAIAALFAIIGHMFPIWLKFRGGKGVATSVGVFLALAPKTLLLALALFVALVAVFRYVSLGSIIAAAALPLIAYGLHDYHSSPEVLAAMCAIAALIVIKHHENIRRLLAGTESHFALKSTRS